MQLATAEYLAVDVETNGLAGDLCELTEVGAVLVGGGELHERWESLVRVERPLSRGIQRFTGITQEMVDAAPPAAEVLPTIAELLDGRILVAHNASFDSRRAQAGVRALRARVARSRRCSARSPSAGASRRSPRGSGWRGWPTSSAIEVEETHRALPDAVTCARIFCALFPKLCANASTVCRRGGARAPRRRPRPVVAALHPIPREDRPDLSRLPDDPGVYVFRDERGRPLYVGKSVSLRSRARAHFCAPAGWTERASIVDYRPTNSELGALVLENRLIKQWRPSGNRSLKRTDRYVYLRCRFDIPYPILEVDPEPAAGHAVQRRPASRAQGGA